MRRAEGWSGYMAIARGQARAGGAGALWVRERMGRREGLDSGWILGDL